MNNNQTDRPDAAGPGPMPVAQGYAAYLLIESLLHELIAREVISTEDAIGIVGIAIETDAALAADADFQQQRSSAELLRSLSLSLHADLPS